MAYGKVHEQFWDDPLLRSKDEPCRVLMLYLITCRHKNRLGCYVLGSGTAAEDLQWSIEKVEAVRQELADAKRIAWDPASRIVFVARFLKWNKLENHKVVTGALKELASLPTTPLLEPLLGAFEQYRLPHYKPVIEALRNRIANDIDTVCHTVGGAIRSRSLTQNQNQNQIPPMVPPLARGDEPEDEIAEGRGPSGKKRATALPEDWDVSESHRTLATQLGVDPDSEAEQFRDHHAARGSTFRDWDRAFNTWLRNAKKFDRNGAGKPDRKTPQKYHYDNPTTEFKGFNR